jgi:hypothetical protein
MPDWIGAWLISIACLFMLFPADRWIHKHLQGLGLLITNDPKGAVLIYYLSLLPGVFLHEGSQWLLAQALRVKIKKFRIWPEKKTSGVIQLGLVDIDDDTDIVRATLISLIPMVTGITAIALIGTFRFDTSALMTALTAGDVPVMLDGIGKFLGAPDFFLWAYLIFAIANAMFPEIHDRFNLWIFAGFAAVVVAFLLLLDLSILLWAIMDGPLAEIARFTSFALSMALVIDLFVMVVIWGLERAFSRVGGREVEYR